MTTAETLGQVHLLQADDASRINALAIRWDIQVHARKALQLGHERSRLDEELRRLVQLDERVKALPQKVQRKLTTRKEP